MSSLTGSALFCVWFKFKKEQANINCLRSLMQIKLSQVSVIAWLAIVSPGIRKCKSASSYVLIFGKLFHVYKPIHID